MAHWRSHASPHGSIGRMNTMGDPVGHLMGHPHRVRVRVRVRVP